ncbi:hypothetical protein ABW19_dt0200384 [Dactylella cylindrospora]|nr:hypothetical protein ABW19_dt0200384 [Dactylella cylindrospora]
MGDLQRMKVATGEYEIVPMGYTQIVEIDEFQKIPSLRKHGGLVRSLLLLQCEPHESWVPVHVPVPTFTGLLEYALPCFTNLIELELHHPLKCPLKEYVSGINVVLKTNLNLAKLKLYLDVAANKRDFCKLEEFPEPETSVHRAQLEELEFYGFDTSAEEWQADKIQGPECDQCLEAFAKVLAPSTGATRTLSWGFPNMQIQSLLDIIRVDTSDARPGDTPEMYRYEEGKPGRFWPMPALRHLRVRLAVAWMWSFNKTLSVDPMAINEISLIHSRYIATIEEVRKSQEMLIARTKVPRSGNLIRKKAKK